MASLPEPDHRPLNTDSPGGLGSLSQGRVISGSQLEALLPADFVPNASLAERVQELKDRIAARLEVTNSNSSPLVFYGHSLRSQLSSNVGLLFAPEFVVVRTDDPQLLARTAKLMAKVEKVTPELHDRFEEIRKEVESGALTLTQTGGRCFTRCLVQMERNPGYLSQSELAFLSNYDKYGTRSEPKRIVNLDNFEPIGRTGLVWGPNDEPLIAFSTSDRRGEPFLSRATTWRYIQSCLRHAGSLSESNPSKHPRLRLLHRAEAWLDEVDSVGKGPARDNFISWLKREFPRY